MRIEPTFFSALKNFRYVYENAQSGFGERQIGNIGSGLEFEDYRAYIPGDDLKYLDWNIYSRLNQLYIKRFKASGVLKVTIIFDRSVSMFADTDKLERAKLLAAALGYVGLNTGETVRLLPFPCLNENELITFNTNKSVLNFIDTIETIKPVKASEHNISLKFAFDKDKSTSLSIIISDIQEEQSWFRFIEYLKGNKQNVFLFHLISLKDLDISDISSELLLTDIEFNTKLKFELTNAIKKKFRQKFAMHLKRLAAFTHSRKIGYIKLTNQSKIDSEIWMKLKNLGLWQ